MKLGLWSIQIRLTLPAASEGILSISTRTSGLQRLRQSVPTPPVGPPGPRARAPRPARALIARHSAQSRCCLAIIDIRSKDALFTKTRELPKGPGVEIGNVVKDANWGRVVLALTPVFRE